MEFYDYEFMHIMTKLIIYTCKHFNPGERKDGTRLVLGYCIEWQKISSEASV